RKGGTLRPGFPIAGAGPRACPRARAVAAHGGAVPSQPGSLPGLRFKDRTTRTPDGGAELRSGKEVEHRGPGGARTHALPVNNRLAPRRKVHTAKRLRHRRSRACRKVAQRTNRMAFGRRRRGRGRSLGIAGSGGPAVLLFTSIHTA